MYENCKFFKFYFCLGMVIKVAKYNKNNNNDNLGTFNKIKTMQFT